MRTIIDAIPPDGRPVPTRFFGGSLDGKVIKIPRRGAHYRAAGGEIYDWIQVVHTEPDRVEYRMGLCCGGASKSLPVEQVFDLLGAKE